MLFQQIPPIYVLPTLPTKLPTMMKNELMLELTNGKYDWEGLVNNPTNPTYEESLYIMDAGEEGRDILLCYKRMICKRIAEAALSPAVHSIASVLVKNNIVDSRMNEELTQEEYIKAMGMLQMSRSKDEPFWEKHTTKMLKENATQLDEIVRQIGELELEHGSPFSQEQIDECYEKILSGEKTNQK